MSRPLGLLSVVCATTLLAAHAEAHDSPNGIGLVWAGDDPFPVVVTNRGLIFSEGGLDARRFSLRCNEAYDLSVGVIPFLWADAKGKLVMAASTAVSLSTDRGCTWQANTSLGEVLIGGVAQHPEQPGTLLLSTLEAQGNSRVMLTLDFGLTWREQVTNEPEEGWKKLLWAPSDPQRVYASGLRADDVSVKAWLLASSVDQGLTWHRIEQPSERRLLAVHPTQADTLFATESLGEDTDRVRLLRSTNAGESFVPVLELARVTSFAYAADGTELWLGARDDGGLYRSRDDGKTFERVHEEIRQVHCLQVRGDVLWACANMQVSESGRGADGVWSSTDRGRTFSETLTFDDINEPTACAGEAAAVCLRPWSDWKREVLPWTPPDASTTTDAGVMEGVARPVESRPTKGSSGCTVSAVGTQSGALPRVWLGLCALLHLGWVQVARRRERTPRPSR